jgi:hypothetical protein
MLQGAITWLTFCLAVPLESIHDIVGSPVLGWPWQMETFGRFLALFAIPTMVMTGISVLLFRPAVGRHRFALAMKGWLGWLIVLLPIAYWVVVPAAATDNLVELMEAGGRLPWFLALVGWLVFSLLPGSAMAASMAGVSRSWIPVWVTLVASLPLGYLTFRVGTEARIIKYGQEFSAMQFLLSSNRENLAIGTALHLRFLLMQTGTILLVFIAQYPFWQFSRASLPGGQR